MDVSLSFLLLDCYVAGETVSFDIELTGRYSANRSTWEFAAKREGGFRERSYKRKHKSHDLEELKRQFNDAVRWIMENLAQLARSDAGD